jgi:putative nucleotidyltransferase with HDIG domain
LTTCMDTVISNEGDLPGCAFVRGILPEEVRKRLAVLLLLLREKDQQLYSHCRRVQHVASRFAQALDLPKDEAAAIELGALFHDIGKTALLELSVLQKASSLTRREFEVIKQHPAAGALLLDQALVPRSVARVVSHHHERWDGLGYPCGLRGEAIPLGARLVAIADAFEAMTYQRSYQRTRTHAQALAELKRCAGTQFDPVLVQYFCSSLASEMMPLVRDEAIPNKKSLAPESYQLELGYAIADADDTLGQHLCPQAAAMNQAFDDAWMRQACEMRTRLAQRDAT